MRDVIREGVGFFELSGEEKERIEMKNEKSFLGWNRVSEKVSCSVNELIVCVFLFLIFFWGYDGLEFLRTRIFGLVWLLCVLSGIEMIISMDGSPGWREASIASSWFVQGKERV